MGELLLEFWSGLRDEDAETRREAKVRRSHKVTDIFTWLQCFGSFVSVRAQQAPAVIPELMAYMATTVRVSQDYDGLAWMRYDTAYRRQAALTVDTHWSTINPTLYTVCFTGMAATTSRCELCFVTSHSEKECAQQGDPEPGTKEHQKAIETTTPPPPPPPPPPPANPKAPNMAPIRPSGEPCRKWNNDNCFFQRCRHSRVCSGCGGAHPVIRCPNRPRV